MKLLVWFDLFQEVRITNIEMWIWGANDRTPTQFKIVMQRSSRGKKGKPEWDNSPQHMHLTEEVGGSVKQHMACAYK